ncbi:MAG: SLC13 family permease [Prevotella sp.]|nr:SLC13 family permease [Prevotella sp.]
MRRRSSTLSRIIKVAVILLVVAVIMLLPTTAFGIDNLTVIQQRMIAIFAFAALMWIAEAVPAWVTSVLVIVVMLFTVSDSAISVLIDVSRYGGVDVTTTEVAGEEITKMTGIIPYGDIMSSFADPTVMLFMGGFILALVASKSGVDITMARIMLRPFGNRPTIVLLGFMFVTAIFSMFVSNTATAAMMLTFLAPVFRTLPERERGRTALALAIPIGCNIGGIATPIGTPPNGIALSALRGAGINIGFLDWVIMMFPLMIVILLIAWFILTRAYKFTAKSLHFTIEGGAEKNWQTTAIYIILVATIILWCGEKIIGINSYVVALFPIGAFAALGIITAEDIKHIDWSVLWMVAGGFALGTGMKASGLAKNLVESIPFEHFPLLEVLIGAGLLCWILSTFISNSASAALLVPILITVGEGMREQLGPVGGVATLVLGIALCASFAMALPISTPPNAIAYSTGLVRTGQMARMGIIVGIISMILGYSLLIFLGSQGYLWQFGR